MTEAVQHFRCAKIVTTERGIEMSLVVNSNISSLAAQRSLAESARSMETAMERLSSGKRINSAADDAAGLAISQRMESQIGGLTQAIRNTVDGRNMVDTMEAGLEEAEDILQRMRTLAVQAASDTVSGTDRVTINNELTALKAELDAMATNTRYGSQLLLDGNFSGKNIQTGTHAGEQVTVSQTSVASGTLGGFVKESNAVAVTQANNADASSGNAADETIKLTGADGVQTAALGANAGSARALAAEINALTSSTGITAEAVNHVELSFADDGSNNSQTFQFTIKTDVAGQTANISALAGVDDVVTMTNALNAVSGTTGLTAKANATGTGVIVTSSVGSDIFIANTTTGASFDITVKNGNFNGTSFSGNIVANDEGTTNDNVMAYGLLKLRSATDFAIDVTNTTIQFGSTDLANVDTDPVSGVSATSSANAQNSIGIIDGAIAKIASMRADLGSISNRLDHSVDRMMVAREASSDALSSISDTDFASESANLAKAQVLQQVATAMLAQANAQPQLALQLLQ